MSLLISTVSRRQNGCLNTCLDDPPNRKARSCSTCMLTFHIRNNAYNCLLGSKYSTLIEIHTYLLMVFQQSYCICKNNVDQTFSTAMKGRVTIGIPVSSPLAANVIDLRTNTRHCSINSQVWKLLFSPSESKVLKIMIHSTWFPHKSIVKHNSSTHYKNINTLSFASSLWQICYIHLSAYCTNWNAVFSRKDWAFITVVHNYFLFTVFYEWTMF